VHAIRDWNPRKSKSQQGRKESEEEKRSAVGRRERNRVRGGRIVGPVSGKQSSEKRKFTTGQEGSNRKGEEVGRPEKGSDLSLHRDEGRRAKKKVYTS